MKARAAKAESTGPTLILRLPPIKVMSMIVNVQSAPNAPLVTHGWGRRSIENLLSRQNKKDKPEEVRCNRTDEVLRQEFLDALYWVSKRPKIVTDAALQKATFGIPTAGFHKGICAAAARYVQGKKGPALRGSFYIPGTLVPIKAPPPEMDMRIVRVGQFKKPDVRVRPLFKEWRAEMQIQYTVGLIEPETLISLLNLAGSSVGICEGRAEKSCPMGWGYYTVTLSE